MHSCKLEHKKKYFWSYTIWQDNGICHSFTIVTENIHLYISSCVPQSVKQVGILLANFTTFECKKSVSHSKGSSFFFLILLKNKTKKKTTQHHHHFIDRHGRIVTQFTPGGYSRYIYRLWLFFSYNIATQNWLGKKKLEFHIGVELFLLLVSV